MYALQTVWLTGREPSYLLVILLSLISSTVVALNETPHLEGNPLQVAAEKSPSQIEHLAVEIRSALNYQTEAIRKEINNLTQVLLSQHGSSASALVGEISDRLKEVGVISRDLETAMVEQANITIHMKALMEDVEVLKREAKKCRRETRANRKVNNELLQRIEETEQTNSVYFDAFRQTDFSGGNLTYTGCYTNVDEAMNLTSGIFTAPATGTYLFTFHANTVKGNDGLVLLRRNGNTIGGIFDTDNYNHNTLSQTTLAFLEETDKVWVEVLSGGVRSNDNIYIHFVGILLKSGQ